MMMPCAGVGVSAASPYRSRSNRYCQADDYSNRRTLNGEARARTRYAAEEHEGLRYAKYRAYPIVSLADLNR